MKKVTIKDLAKMANVSATTVSLVLNNKKSRISKAKKEEIFLLAKKHNYVPNLNAKGLVTNKTNIIGLIIPDIENPFFSSLAKVVETKLNKNGYSLILFNTNDLFENDLKAINLLNGRGVDGFLIVLSNESYLSLDKIKEELLSLNKPYVLIDRTFDNIKTNSVSFDDEYGGYIGTKYLIERNHKKIGFISAPKYSFNGVKRTIGYKNAVIEANLYNEELIKYGDYKFDSGYKLANELLDLKVDSIFTANDVMAYGAIKAIAERGLVIKKDISLIGYDDLLFSDLKLVSLTTIKQDQEQLGKESVRLLLNNIKEKEKIEQITLRPELIIRDTVK